MAGTTMAGRYGTHPSIRTDGDQSRGITQRPPAGQRGPEHTGPTLTSGHTRANQHLYEDLDPTLNRIGTDITPQGEHTHRCVTTTPDGKATLSYSETVKGTAEHCDCSYLNGTRLAGAQERFNLMRHLNDHMRENGQHTVDMSLNRTYHRLEDYRVDDAPNGYRYVTYLGPDGSDLVRVHETQTAASSTAPNH